MALALIIILISTILIVIKLIIFIYFLIKIVIKVFSELYYTNKYYQNLKNPFFLRNNN